MKKIMITLSLLAVCAATPALACHHDDNMDGQDKMGMMMQMKTDYYMAKADKNRDGYVTRMEAEMNGKNMFMDADRNGDGKLSGQEIMDEKFNEHDDMKAWAHSDMDGRRDRD